MPGLYEGIDKGEVPMGLNVGVTFTNQNILTVPQSIHGLGHAQLRIQVWDEQVPRRRLAPGSLRVDPSTLAIQATFLQAASGLLVVNGAAPLAGPQGNQVFSFGAQTTWTVFGSQHGYGSDHLLIDVYDNSMPRVWLPNVAVSVHPTTFDVTISFLQPQAGIVCLCAAADVGTPNLGYALPGTPTVTVPGTTHGLGTANLGPQFYDTTGLAVLPGRLTVDPITFTVTATFLQAQLGTLVLNGSFVPLTAPIPLLIFAQTPTLVAASQGAQPLLRGLTS